MPRQEVRLRAQLRELAPESASAILGPHRYAELTLGDDAPLFVSMIVAHEGTSSGEVRGLGARVKEWGKRAVRACVRAFRPQGRFPAAVFDGLVNWHGNQHNRQPVGDVVHSRLTELEGVEACETIGYIFPEQTELRAAIRNGERDCCSLEADAVLTEENGRLVIDDVERGTGIVLGHSSRQMPGFQFARVQQLCEFEPPEGGQQTGGTSQPPTPAGQPQPATGAGGVSPAAPAGDPAPTPTPAQPVPPSREQVLQMARAAGLTAADFGGSPPPPVLAPIPAPPEKPVAPAGPLDLTDPKHNPFLPAE